MKLFAYLPPAVPFLFAALVVGGLASKTLHIALHFHSLPLLYFVLYSPTLVLQDIFVIAFARVLLLTPTPEIKLQWLSTVLGGILSLIVWGASSVQWGFFMQTGAEVDWAASNSFLSDPAAMKILLSGISTVSAAGTIIGLVAWLANTKFYHWTGLGLQAIRGLFSSGIRSRYTLLGVPDRSWLSTSWLTKMDFKTTCRVAIIVSLSSSLLFLELTRPSIPYDHLSGALPLTLLDAFSKKSVTTSGCRQPSQKFPLWTSVNPGLLANGWSRPSWLPESPPSGFSRYEHSPEELAVKDNPSWYGCNEAEPGFYNPKKDPLKISNLDGEIYAPLKAAFDKHNVEIEHVILVTLESGRKEVFPMQQGTPMFDALLDSHPKEEREQAIDKLVTMTPVSQMLTGEYATDSKGQRVNLTGANWQDSAPEGMGGLNVRGAITGSSLTFKSVLGSHCGVHPLPVDLLEETELEIYQPCLPQLFELFNTVKGSDAGSSRSERDESAPPAWKNPWKSVFMQSITDGYDRQDTLNENMGFKHKVVKSTLTSSGSKYQAQGSEINYFGYAETELKPYIKDLFEEAAHNKTRMFLSHITSTTHHPWNTPDDFRNDDYMGSRGSINHTPMNNYLNTVRFVDGWLGEIMAMLDQTGIANSTLVVIVGDHGQAFAEDHKEMTGTYENGHISNYRVPIVFRHPHMPRLNIDANATSISIIPTILDLLIQSKSLDPRDSEMASALLSDYQGQSLIRPFVPSIKQNPDANAQAPRETNSRISRKPHSKPGDHTQHNWNFGIVNAGGSMVAVTAAGTPWRLILPLKENFEYIFSDLDKDPGELHPLNAWTIKELLKEVSSKYGDAAAKWTRDAERVGKWWVNEQRRNWGYREA
ncbi:hypothetical protein N7539_006644 [Penicillium diatomitis]|uniref:Sulfatase N-terminal domain-containing protein n=1 Tax=Penicillium diatomitis TaxID=2819901 RepID=A0A9W9X1M6_9EURO|nr:uncharacterized protein N7539_006644 [Penicillium diatomitis]KAJ5480750.1 hypothetical protein N7539_006644 [Penicillium diatomitis]